MKKIFSIILAVVIVFSISACGKENSDSASSQNSGSNKESASENPAPDFTLADISGKEHKLSDYKGKKVYIKFWASWCGPCLRSLPHTEKLAKEEKDFVVLTVASPGYGSEKPLEEFKAWYGNQGYKNMPVLLDEGGKIAARYNVRAYPTNVSINAKGEISEILPGALSEEQIKDFMGSAK